MSTKQIIEQKLQHLEKFNDPVVLLMVFLTIPGVIMITLFSLYGSGTVVKVAVAIIFILFTLAGIKINSIIKSRLEKLKSELEAQI